MSKVRQHVRAILAGSVHHVGAMLLVMALRTLLIFGLGAAGMAGAAEFAPHAEAAPAVMAYHV